MEVVDEIKTALVVAQQAIERASSPECSENVALIVLADKIERLARLIQVPEEVSKEIKDLIGLKRRHVTFVVGQPMESVFEKNFRLQEENRILRNDLNEANHRLYMVQHETREIEERHYKAYEGLAKEIIEVYGGANISLADLPATIRSDQEYLGRIKVKHTELQDQFDVLKNNETQLREYLSERRGVTIGESFEDVLRVIEGVFEELVAAMDQRADWKKKCFAALYGSKIEIPDLKREAKKISDVLALLQAPDVTLPRVTESINALNEVFNNLMAAVELEEVPVTVVESSDPETIVKNALHWLRLGRKFSDDVEAGCKHVSLLISLVEKMKDLPPPTPQIAEESFQRLKEKLSKAHWRNVGQNDRRAIRTDDMKTILALCTTLEKALKDVRTEAANSIYDTWLEAWKRGRSIITDTPEHAFNVSEAALIAKRLREDPVIFPS